jgi:N-succinyldiaminopimelate aminotransferase
VVANRALYRQKFAQVTPLLASVLDVKLPDAAFYLWAALPPGGPQDDIAWARGLLAQYNVAVLPGSLLARSVAGHTPPNPGTGRIRMALVAPLAECLEAAQRIVAYSSRLLESS